MFSWIQLVVINRFVVSYYTDDFAVELEPGINPNQLANDHNCHNQGEFLPNIFHFRHTKVHRRSATQSNSHRFNTDPRIISFEQQFAKIRKKRDYNEEIYSSSNKPNDPLFNKMFYLDPDYPNRKRKNEIRHMNITGAWAQGYSGKGVVLTILDDGIEHSHRDLKPNYDPQASFDINDDDADPMPAYNKRNNGIKFNDDSSYKDSDSVAKLTENVIGYTKEINRHGTRCAGEVAAVANNNACVPGIAYNAKVGGIRMLDGDVTDIVESKSIGWRPDHVDIYSASWGPDDDGKTVDGPAKLAKIAFKNGALNGRSGLGSIFVWASGNGGRYSDNCNCDGYTNSIYTISISSTSENEKIPWYSEFCASTFASTYSSGTNSEKQIVTTDLRGICTGRHTGTSASAPIAAAILALALEANRKLSWRDMQHLLVRTSRRRLLESPDWKVNSLGRDYSHRYGYGLIDAGALVELASVWVSVPEQRNQTVLYNGGKSHSFTDKLIAQIEFLPNSYPLNIDKLEHVIIIASISFQPRGNLRLRLVSPHGTESIILEKRPQDYSSKGFDKFEFLSVHFWDESPYGNWTFHAENIGSLESSVTGSISNLGIRIHGNGFDQFDIDCPSNQIYDQSSGICLDNCPEGTYNKIMPSSKNGTVNQCHRCPRNCLICSDQNQCIKMRPIRDDPDKIKNSEKRQIITTDQMNESLEHHRLALSFLVFAVALAALIFLQKFKKKKTIIYTPLPNM